MAAPSQMLDADGIPAVIDEHFIPKTEAQLKAALTSWRWRILSGLIYKITTKGDDADDDEPDIAVPFVPNRAQRRFIEKMWTRNIILKARQMGFSTLIEIMALDHALFNKDQEVVVIAHTKDAATKLYRKKVCFAYDNLPEAIRDMCPTIERSQTQMVFANGSSIEVTSSARGGTPHFLHISEMGKIAAKFPDKAVEITTGSLQGVPKNGMVFIESTAEGKAGQFYDLSMRAQRLLMQAVALSMTDYRFHFFPWFSDPGYVLDPSNVRITSRDHDYFDKIEGESGQAIQIEQRAWYVSKRDNDFMTTPDLMWREYPSTAEECWQSSTEGKILAQVMAICRRDHRIRQVPVLRHLPVNSFWDIGATDDTVCWLHQSVGMMDHWVNYREGSGEGFLAFILWMESLGYVWGTHFLPHDASSKVNGIETPTSMVTQLRATRPSWTWRVVPRTPTIQHGIDQLRNDFSTYVFDETNCKQGLAHLDNYSREWNTRLQVWGDQPRHDEHSHAADAIRQKAQGFMRGNEQPKKPARARPTGMTA